MNKFYIITVKFRTLLLYLNESNKEEYCANCCIFQRACFFKIFVNKLLAGKFLNI